MSNSRSVSRFAQVARAPADAILGLSTRFQQDSNASKINLGVGAYRDGNGQPWLLPSITKATEQVHHQLMHSGDTKVNFEYIPILGTQRYRDLVREFLFENTTMKTSTQLSQDGHVLTMQGLSGTGSLRVMCEFLAKFAPKELKNIYVPSPTWPNHKQIAKAAGLNVAEYTYYDSKTMGLDFEGMLSSLESLPKGSGVLLHVCCHNPTGVDPSIEQWSQIIDVMARRDLYPLLDMAYQGYGSGLEEDLSVLELFSQQITSGKMSGYMLSQSWAKNMGLYGERVGSFSYVTSNPAEVPAIQSQFEIVARGMYSSPPGNGARIVSQVLSDPQLKLQWSEDVDTMAERLRDMRRVLFDQLQAIGCHGPGQGNTGWEHLVEQRGMFCFTGLRAPQVEKLLEKSVYLTGNGRISIAGITEANSEYLAKCIKEVS